MKKRFDQAIMLLIFFMPIFDILTGYLNWQNVSFPIFTLIKGLFMAAAMVYLWVNKKHRGIMIGIILFFLFYTGFYYFNGYALITELTYLIKIAYFPILALFFANYESEYFNKSTLVAVYIIYLLTYILPGVFGFGHNLSEIYPDKSAYLGMYYAGNELTAVVLCLLPLVIDYLIKKGTILYRIIVFSLTIITVYLLGTKALFLGIIIILLYFCYFIVKKINWKKRWYIIPLILLSCFLVYKSPVVSNMKATLEFYHVDEFKYIFTLESIDNVIFSKRISFLQNIKEQYGNADLQTKLFGLGREQILNIKDVEIDIFDIYFAIGLIGFIFYFALFAFVIYKYKLRGIYQFSFLLLLITSLFTGHILNSPMVGIWLATLFFFHNDKKQTKKKVLLISNMYPSKKFKHYGSFVKNAEEALKEKDFIVHKCIVKKQTNSVFKLLAYIGFCLSTVFKAMLGNYDYYYVHFISHSTKPLFLVRLFLTSGKVILNAHGNDVMVDTNRDIPNIARSKKALTIADALIVPSKYYQGIMEKEYSLDSNLIYVYPSGGINFEVFHEMDKKQAKIDLGLNPETIYYGFISRIERDKGWDTLALAISELNKQKKLNNIKVIMIGIGDEEPELNKLIKKHQLEEIIIRKEMVLQTELCTYYNAFDLFIFPTKRKSDSLGLVGLEAMACSTFVITGNKYGPTDYAIHDYNAFVFDSENSNDLANKIIDFQKLPKKEKELILKNALDTARKYDKEAIKEDLVQIFNEV